MSSNNTELLRKYINDKGEFDFNLLTPMPEDIRDTTSGGHVKELVALYLLQYNTLPACREIYGQYPQLIPMGIDFRKKKQTVQELIRRVGGQLFDEVKRRDPDSDDYKEITIKTLSGGDYWDIFMKYGYLDWYQWACGNWSTKWNACNTEVSGSDIYFDTPWNPPFKVFEAICAAWPDEYIYFYCDEEAGEFWEMQNDHGILACTRHGFSQYDEEKDEDIEIDDTEEFLKHW